MLPIKQSGDLRSGTLPVGILLQWGMCSLHWLCLSANVLFCPRGSAHLQHSSKGSHSRARPALGPVGGGVPGCSVICSWNWKLPGPFFRLHPWKLIVRLSYTHTTTLFPADVNPSAVKPVPITQRSLHGGKKKRSHLFLLGHQRMLQGSLAPWHWW